MPAACRASPQATMPAAELVTLAPDVILTSGSVAKGRGRALVSGECLYLAALIESAGDPRLMRLVAS